MRRAGLVAVSAALALLACGAPPERPPLSVRTRALVEGLAPSAPPREVPLPDAASVEAARTSADARPRIFTLPTSGIRVVYRRLGGAPRVTLGAFFETEVDDPPAVRVLHGGLLLHTTGDVDVDEWLGDFGALVARGAGSTGTYVEVTTIAPHFEEVARQVGANLTTPVLGGPRVAGARARLRLSHELAERSPAVRALGAVTGALLPGVGYDTWFARIPPAMLDAVNLDQLRAFHARTAVSERMVLSVVGPISEEEARAVLDRAFAGVRHGTPARAISAPALARPAREVIVLDDPHVREAKVFAAVRGPDPRAGEAARARGEAKGWGAAVHGALRLQRGASYVAAASWLPLRGASLAVAQASISPSDAAIAVQAMTESLARRSAAPTRRDPPRTREELAHDDALDLAFGGAGVAKAPSAGPVLDLENVVFVVVGDAAVVRPTLDAAGIPCEVRPRD